MKAELKFDCKNCIDDITIDVEFVGKTMTDFTKIRGMAYQQGWSIGRDCYCPSCYANLPSHCGTCEHFEGNKSMGGLRCRRDGNFTTSYDYCEHYQPFHGHKEKGGGEE